MKLRNKKTKPKIDISTNIFDKVLAYCFSTYVNRPFIKKLKLFFSTISTIEFEQDTDIRPRYKLLLLFIEYYYDQGINDEDILFEKIENNKAIDDEDKEAILINAINKSESITGNDALAIENLIIERYNYASTVEPIDSLSELISNYKKSNFNSFEEIITDIHKQTLLFNKCLAAKSTSNLEIPEIDFKADSFQEIFNKIHKDLTNKKRYIKTGIKKLNTLLSGGWQPGRVYVILGITGG